MTHSITQPLSGYRVLDLSRILAGPYCTMMLGDQGADVIKVERPGAGDDTRLWGPPFVGGESAYYLCCNRNKRSILVDLRSPAGIDLILDLARVSDVLVHNFTPGLMDEFGLGYERLHELNPRLVYASISAYGQDGPYRDRPGYDMVLSAVGGLMHITGEADGPPTKVGVAITDVLTGVHAAGAISSALLFRERTGRGQHLDISLLDVQVSALANIASNYLVADQEAQRWGTAHASIVPYQVFQAQDRPIAIAVANPKQWTNFCRALGQDGWEQDQRFATNELRVENREVFLAELGQLLKTKTCDAWLELLIPAAVPAGPVNDMQHLFSDPQVHHRNMVETVQHPAIGPLKMVGLPIKASESPGSVRLAPPMLGEHTDEVLREVLGCTDERVESLRSDGAIG